MTEPTESHTRAQHCDTSRERESRGTSTDNQYFDKWIIEGESSLKSCGIVGKGKTHIHYCPKVWCQYMITYVYMYSMYLFIKKGAD